MFYKDCSLGSERETDRQTDRQTETEDTERERDTHTDRDRRTDRETETQRQRERETDRERSPFTYVPSFVHRTATSACRSFESRVFDRCFLPLLTY